MNVQFLTKFLNIVSFMGSKICIKLLQRNQIQENMPAEGMGDGLVKFIMEAKNSPIALHDLKIKLSSNLHKYMEEQGYPINKKNKMIQLSMKTKNYSAVKVNVYPKTITIDIGCSNEPLTFLPAGAVRLSSLVSDILHFLCEQSSHKAEIAPIENWVLTHYHKNRDGKMTFNSNNFHIMLEDALGKVTRAYSKTFPDGSVFVRIEEIGTKKIPIPQLLENMRNSRSF